MARSNTERIPRIPETEEQSQLIKAGEKAFEQLKKTFDHWMDIAHALEAGRDACLAYAEVPADKERGKEGKKFNQAYSNWLKRHDRLKLSEDSGTAKTIRKWLYKCLEHEQPIREWRSQQSVVDQTRFQFPESVFKAWEKSDPSAPPKEKKPRKTPEEKKSEDQRHLDYARREIKKVKDEWGDWDQDRASDIAEKLQNSYPDKAEEVAALLLSEDRTVRAGLDWEAPEESLVETLLGMIPNNTKSIRVLRAVLEKLEAAPTPSESEAATMH